MSIVYVSNEISSNGLFFSSQLKTNLTAKEGLSIMFFANSLCATLFLLLFAIICITNGCGFDKLIFCFGDSLQQMQFCFVDIHLNS